MRRYSRRRSPTGVAVWCTALAAITITAAWHFGWVPVGSDEVETGQIADAGGAPLDESDDETVRALSADEEFSASSLVDESEFGSEPVVLNEQSDPPPSHRPFHERGRRNEPVQVTPRRSLLSDARNRGTENYNLPPDAPGALLPGAIPDAARNAARPINPSSIGVEPGRLRSPAGRSARATPGIDFQPEPSTQVRRDSEIRLASASRMEDPPIRSTMRSTDRTDARGPSIDMTEIDALIEAGDVLAAHRMLSSIYWKRPEVRDDVQTRIDETARSIYFSPRPDYMPPYEIQPGDRLSRVADRYGVSWQYLVRLNRVDPRKIRPGQKLKVIKGPFQALVDLSDFEMTVFAHGYYVRRYKVGIGRDGGTPVGRYKVLNKVVNPQYTDPEGRVIAGDDPANPLGERWLDLGDGYGIHGTLNPDSIGKAMSAGCVRMRNEEVEEVYDLLGVGSEVVIQR